MSCPRPDTAAGEGCPASAGIRDKAACPLGIPDSVEANGATSQAEAISSRMLRAIAFMSLGLAACAHGSATSGSIRHRFLAHFTLLLAVPGRCPTHSRPGNNVIIPIAFVTSGLIRNRTWFGTSLLAL